MKKLLLTAAFVLSFGGAAYADSLDFSNPTVTPVGTNFLWSYTVTIDSFEHINTAVDPSFITLYDVNGIVSAPTYTAALSEPSGTTSVQDVGITPFDQLPKDNPTVPNITVNYSGTASSSQTLGVLSFLDTQNASNSVDENFSAQAILNSDGALQGNTSSVPVPAPEPSSIMLVALGVAGLASRFIKH